MPFVEVPEIDKAQWHDWKQMPATKAFVADVLNYREEIKEGLVDGHYTDNEARLQAIGQALGLKEVVTYIIEGLKYQANLAEEEENNHAESDSVSDYSET